MTIDNAESKESIALGHYQKMRRLLLFIGILIVGGAMMSIASAWQNPAVSERVELTGIALIWFGIIGRLWSILYIGGHKSNMVIVDGPYSVMRNPLYFFSTLAAIGVGFQTGTLTAGLLFGLLCYLAFSIVIRREEKHLGGIFGEPYAAYCASVPRFFPNPALFKDPETLNISTKRLYATLFDGLVFFVAMPLFELAEYLQTSGVIPVLLRLY
mgnify:CR=1 FL=1